MKAIATVLRAIATELAFDAKQNLPKLKEGETIKEEYLSNGIYICKTSLGNQYKYDFRQKNLCG